MKKKGLLRSMVTSAAVAGMLFSSIPAFASEAESPVLPESLNIDGKEVILEKSESNTAIFTPSLNKFDQIQTLATYKLIGSDVGLYVDYSHGHGGDHYAHGWVQTTAPRFTARAEVWENGKVIATGTNNLNSGNTAYGTSTLAVGIAGKRTPRIFYAW